MKGSPKKGDPQGGLSVGHIVVAPLTLVVGYDVFLCLRGFGDVCISVSVLDSLELIETSFHFLSLPKTLLDFLDLKKFTEAAKFS